MSGQHINYSSWENDEWISDEQFYSPNEMSINCNQIKEEHNQRTGPEVSPALHIYSENYTSVMGFLYEPSNQGFTHPSLIYENSNIGRITCRNERNGIGIDEPPLLEELEIYPNQILEKIKVVLDPFRDSVPCDSDLSGPVMFYLCLALCMFLSGGKFNFGYVYGISVTGCIMMYFLLKNITDSDKISLLTVSSVLGYCILPIVVFSAFGIFFSLKNIFGYVMALITICWASYAASKIFCMLTKNYSQRPLIMYPCALLYGLFTLLVFF